MIAQMTFDGKVCVETKCYLCGGISQTIVEEADFNRWKAGEYIQDVWPEKTANEREIIKTGIHPACWERME